MPPSPIYPVEKLLHLLKVLINQTIARKHPSVRVKALVLKENCANSLWVFIHVLTTHANHGLPML